MILLLSTVHLSDLYFNQPLLLLISPTTPPTGNDIEKIQKIDRALQSGAYDLYFIRRCECQFLLKELVLTTKSSLQFKAELFTHLRLTVQLAF